jgi:hypothetical protein
MNRTKALYLIATVIIVASCVLAIGSLIGDSPTLDEVPHIGAGYSYLSRLSMHLNPEHPPLAKDLAALPLIFMHLDQSVFKSSAWVDSYKQRREYGQWDFGRELLYDHGDDGEAIKNAMRIPMLLFFVLAAMMVFHWSRRRYGDTGGLIALILFAFSPSIVAHARLVTTDVAAACGVLYATYYFVQYLHSPTRKNMLIASIVLGLALLTKFSTFLLIPFFGMLAFAFGIAQSSSQWDTRIVHGIKHALRTAIVSILAFLIVIWPMYALHNLGYAASRQLQDTQDITSYWSNRSAASMIVWAADKPVIRYAGHYLLGLMMASQRAAGGNTIFFLGQVVESGGPIYFPIVYFMKETLAWWVLVLIAILGTAYRIRGIHGGHVLHWIRTHFDEFAMFLWFLIYWGVSMKSHLNLGVRHILPTFPFAIMLVSGQIARMIEEFQQFDRKRLKAFSLLIALLLGWHVFENVKTYPYYLTYFNEAVGGPSQGHKYVTDSNLDWGQDLKRLGQFIQDNNIKKMDVDFFGWGDRNLYLGSSHYTWTGADTYMNAKDFLARNTSDGWIAVSATFYMQCISPSRDKPRTPCYQWLEAYEPVTLVGNSIFVWHITK